MIIYILGWILIFDGLFMVVPLVTGLIYSESSVISYAVSILICAVLGAVMVIKKPKSKTIYKREGFIIVSLSWIVLSLFGCLPFFISGEIPSFVDALFETVSGFTTTGATILSDVEHLSHAALIWRSFIHWIGGMGVLVFLMAILTFSGVPSMHILQAESPGPSVSKVTPKISKTAQILYVIYFGLTVLEMTALLIAGMPLFDAICTAAATAGTGGFGVKNDSIGGYSYAIQNIVTVFMILFAINFNSYIVLIYSKFIQLFREKKIKDVFNSEVRVFLTIIICSVTLITINVRGMFDTLSDAVHHVAFTVASIISSTGFSTVDFNAWPEFSRTVIVLLMFIGACAGSTGGGIKVSRIMILFKGMAKELEMIVHPNQVKKLSMDGHPIDHEVVRQTNSYMVCYILVFTLSLIAVSFDDLDLITNFTAVTTTLNNIGPGLDMVGPTQNFGFLSIPTKCVLIFDMLAGRLELFPVLMLFSPATWKK